MQDWNRGDLISLMVGFVFAAFAFWRRPNTRNKDTVIQNFATGTALGPVGLLLMSPIAATLAMFGYWSTTFTAMSATLLHVATNETRVALVFSAFIAAVYMVDSALHGQKP